MEHAHSDLDDASRLTRAPARPTADGPVSVPGSAVAAVLRLQRTARNRAVRSLLTRPGPGRPAAPSVQRCPVHEHDAADDSVLQRRVERQVLQRLEERVPQVQREEEPSPEPVPLDDAPTAGGTAAAVTPTFDRSGDTTVEISADTAVEFSRAITATIGAPHVQPVFHPHIDYTTTTVPGPDGEGEQEVPGSRTISAVGLTVSTAVTKVSWRSGRPDDENKRAISEMVTRIAAHEAEHRRIIETAAASALTAAQKYVGTKSFAQARTSISTTLECTTNKQHEALDAKEGLLTAAESIDPAGKVTVTVTASGAGTKYPCPAPAKP